MASSYLFFTIRSSDIVVVAAAIVLIIVLIAWSLMRLRTQHRPQCITLRHLQSAIAAVCTGAGSVSMMQNHISSLNQDQRVVAVAHGQVWTADDAVKEFTQENQAPSWTGRAMVRRGHAFLTVS